MRLIVPVKLETVTVSASSPSSPLSLSLALSLPRCLPLSPTPVPLVVKGTSERPEHDMGNDLGLYLVHRPDSLYGYLCERELGNYMNMALDTAPLILAQ